MFTKLFRVVAITAILASLSVVAPAQRRSGMGRSEMLGSANVDGSTDHDRISVNTDRPYRAIQIRVRNASIAFQRVVIHYDSGADHAVPLQNRIAAGNTSRWIDLPGDRRRIRSVELWYSRGTSNSRRPRLELYGRA